MLIRIRPVVLACVVLAVFSSCGKQLPELLHETALEQILYSDESEWRDEEGKGAQVTIRADTTWNRYWELVTGSADDIPAVDFRSHMLLLFNAGEMNPGDRIRIHELLPEAGKLWALFSIDESGVTGPPVFPVQIVRVRRQNAEVAWRPRTNFSR